VAYDLLSINIGSTPWLGEVPGAELHAVPAKPIRRFTVLGPRTDDGGGPATR
jgi:selenide,water dikinase